MWVRFGSVFLLLISVQHGSALMCYNCNGSTNSACEDPFDASQFELFDCNNLLPHEDSTCIKMRQEYPPGIWETLRMCMSKSSIGNYHDKCHWHIRTINDEHCSTCDIDGCNAASSPLTPGLLLLLAVYWLARA